MEGSEETSLRIAEALEAIDARLARMETHLGQFAAHAQEAHPKVLAIIDKVSTIIDQNAGKIALAARMIKK